LLARERARNAAQPEQSEQSEQSEHEAIDVAAWMVLVQSLMNHTEQRVSR
jgi:hypothetical protein